MPQTKLPIGIQDFESIITHGYTYIDKTKLIYELITQGKPYFLSRPRRFGKSLLISTLNALFSGRRDLFKNLWIDKSDWDWTTYPIIRLDMSTINSKTPEMFEADLIRALNDIAFSYHITLTGVSPENYLTNLIKQLSLKGFENGLPKSNVVVLIDEYDKPILDQIDHIELAENNRDALRTFYSVLKSQDEYLRFVLLTGITKFSKVSVFSGLNNLNDLSMLNNYSDLLGYTREELEFYFHKDINKVAVVNQLTTDQCYNKIKEWYNGYQFSKYGKLVYNPFSTLKMLQSKDFSAYWFETGTPTFLIRLIKNREFDISNLEGTDTTEQSFNTFDISNLHMLPLLYQTGYLTIKAVLPEFNALTLGFPNREVNQAFSESLLKEFSSSESKFNIFLIDIAKNLRLNPWDHSKFFECMENLLALIPYDLYIKQEKYFHSLFFLIVKLAGFQINAEIHTQQGRLDASLLTADKTIIFEFKFGETKQIAIDQIKKKKYYEIYEERKLPIYLVSINFNAEKRVINDWQVEQIEINKT